MGNLILTSNFLFELSFIFFPMCVLCCAVLCFLFRTCTKIRKPTVRKYSYVHTCLRACGVRVVFLEHGALGICKSCARTYRYNFGPFCSVSFSRVSERSGPNRALREAPCIPDLYLVSMIYVLVPVSSCSKVGAWEPYNLRIISYSN